MPARQTQMHLVVRCAHPSTARCAHTWFTAWSRLWPNQTKHEGWYLGPSPNLLDAAAFKSLTNLPIPSATQQQGDALSPAIPQKMTRAWRAKN